VATDLAVSLDLDIVAAINEAVAMAIKQTTAVGTVAAMSFDSNVMVTLDGSTQAVPCKVFGDVQAYEGDRVGLVLLGRWWTVVGSFTKRWPSNVGVSVAQSGGTTTSSSFADTPAVVECAYTKRWDTTWTRVEILAQAFLSGTPASSVQFGVKFTSLSESAVTVNVAFFNFNSASVHTQIGGVVYIDDTTISPGTYAARVVWKRVAGAATIQVDGNDTIALSVEEVVPQ
jgi:hypothetical protein